MYGSTGVQSLEHTADLIKVGGVTRSPNLEKSPSILGGKVERFCDIGNMICQWEEMEGEVLKSAREERGRRECRRVNKRISELMGSFEEGGGYLKTENWMLEVTHLIENQKQTYYYYHYLYYLQKISFQQLLNCQTVLKFRMQVRKTDLCRKELIG